MKLKLTIDMNEELLKCIENLENRMDEAHDAVKHLTFYEVDPIMLMELSDVLDILEEDEE